MNDAQAIARLRSWPRAHIADLPTRLLSAPRLGGALGAPHLYMKMDAETGFALGGNKVRKLEFELEPQRLEGVTHIITSGGPQSNHCRVTAAYAARVGRSCVLVVQAPEPETPTGNALLHRLFGAEIVTVEDRTLRDSGMLEAAEKLRAEGHHPMILPIGASTPLGSLGYALAALELVQQLDALSDGCSETRLFVPSSSCGTLAGLVLGMALLGRTDIRLVGVSADADEPTILETTRALAREGAGLLGAPTLDVEAVPLSADASQVGAGYAMPTDASTEALNLFASKEGLVLDPTYTAKAAAGLIAAVRAGPPTPSERIVFLHTGGAPGLLG